MALELDDIEDQISTAMDAVMNGENVAALDALSEIQNLMLTLEKEPNILKDIKSIKDSLSNNDLNKATEDLTKIQNQITTVKSQNPEIMNENDSNGDDEEG